MKAFKPKLEFRDPKSLIPYEKNSKIHSDSQIEKIAGLIDRFGFDQPIVVDKDSVIIKGHGRREAAIQLRLKSVPVIVSTVDEYEAIAARIADNKVAESPWDFMNLKFEMQTLESHGIDVEVTGFLESEIAIMSDPWKTDLDSVEKLNPTLAASSGKIIISCPLEMRSELKDFIKSRIDEQGFEGVEID
jgi:hypothetical protein